MNTQKILLPFDGSTHSINATKYALNLASVFGSHITIMNCYEVTGNIFSSEIPESLVVEIQANVKKALKKCY
ncbi:universal stress protein [Psychromonas sp. KJ10-10]|uniref:universal stress protein n=1 Tax=Psychromonas sp. KJ10-10 TaxID=3391823 RepID=UPI0039B41C25